MEEGVEMEEEMEEVEGAVEDPVARLRLGEGE